MNNKIRNVVSERMCPSITFLSLLCWNTPSSFAHGGELMTSRPHWGLGPIRSCMIDAGTVTAFRF